MPRYLPKTYVLCTQDFQLQLQLEFLIAATDPINFSKRMQIFAKSWEPNGWVGRGRGVVGAPLKGNPFVGRIRGVVREAEQQQQTRRRSPTPGQPRTQGLVYVVLGNPSL